MSTQSKNGHSTKATEHSAEHAFKGTWRWPEKFENWVASLLEDVDGRTANVFAGLSPLADVRYDLRTPTELVKNLQQDDGTNLSEAREYLSGFVVDDAPFDVVGSLYSAAVPQESIAAEYLDDGNTIISDILENGIPASDDSFSMIVCDPPWKDVPDFEFLFSELVRVTEPGGRILFNSYAVPTGDLPITLDHVFVRRDDTRWQRGTPNISWACLYTVHPSIDVLRHLPRTLGRRQEFEFVPTAKSFEQAVRAERVFELTRVHEIPIGSINPDVVDPASKDHSCPQCGCSHLDPVFMSPVDDQSNAVDFYECVDCGFRATEHETVQEPQQGGTPQTRLSECTPQ